MTYTSLLESVEESAREREQELNEKAERTIREISEEASEEADLLKKRHMESAVRTAVAERNKERYLINARNKRDLILAKEELYAESYAQAEKELSALRSDPLYREIFRALLEEAYGNLADPDVTIHIDKKDLGVCKNVLESIPLKAEISTDITTRGGVVVTNRAGDVVIANTAESRLERARELMRLEIFAILEGS